MMELEQKGGFIPLLLGTLGDNLLENMLGGEGVIRDGEGVIQAGKGTIIAGIDF